MSTPFHSFLRINISHNLSKASKAHLGSSLICSCRNIRHVKYSLTFQRNVKRSLATIGHEIKSTIKFRAMKPYALLESPKNVPNSNERNLKLGKTLRILQERLPTLLQRPLPSELLSPNITLNLFPSTHPHLPSVSGRVAYSAALWTSPIAWGRLPLISNVRLEIISERMIKHAHLYCSSHNVRPEQLVVRWRTASYGRTQDSATSNINSGHTDNVEKITEWLSGIRKYDDVRKDFSGLFIFEFDENGRIVTHTIEHAQEGGNWERGVGAKVVGLTDWLLGGMKRNGHREGTPCPAFCDGESKYKYNLRIK